MKKFLILFLVGILSILPTYSKTDKTSVEYLKNKRHFSIMNPAAESVAQKVIKKLIAEESGCDFDVKFTGYTLSSMKRGIFKYLELEGKDIVVEGIPVPYANVKTVTDYNWVDYKQNPPVFKTDIEFAYTVKLSEDSINSALQHEEYLKVLDKLNKKAYPLFVAKIVKVRIFENKLHIIMRYNFPIRPAKNDRTFVVTTGLKVHNNKIVADKIAINEAYQSLPLEKVINLVNYLDPLNFTLSIMNTKKCNAKIENVKIIDDLVEINGKIFVEGD